MSNVSVDWQVQVRPGADPAAVLDAVRAAAGTVTAPTYFQDGSARDLLNTLPAAPDSIEDRAPWLRRSRHPPIPVLREL